MFKCISEKDRLVMANSRFVKNAVFYKDMFAFYDFYENLMNLKDSDKPNYCILPRGGYCLEGICLVAKNYASELGFETLNLSLNYLKILYYSICSYASELGEVSKSSIENEFEEYKKASKQASENLLTEVIKAEQVYEKSSKKFETENSTQAKYLVLSKIYNVLYILFLVSGFVSAMVPFSFYFFSSLSLSTTIIGSAVCLVVGCGLAFCFEYLEKFYTIKSSDIVYQMQVLKKGKDADFMSLQNISSNRNKILSEKYEYSHHMFGDLKKYTTVLEFDKIIEKASEYRLLSYNFENDIKSLFASEQAEIVSVLQELDSIKTNAEAKSFDGLYKEISEKDWLYYSNQIRFAFLCKFIAVAEKTKNWTIDFCGNKIYPFGINVKKIAKEQVAFLKSNSSLFVASTFDKFVSTKFIKNLQALEIKNKPSFDELKKVKTEYMKCFYDYEKLQSYNNLFYGKVINENIAISPDIIENDTKIPSLVAIKIKVIEDRCGYGNNNSDVIKQMSKLLFDDADDDVASDVVGDEVLEMKPLTISDIAYDCTKCEKAVVLNDYQVLYTSNGDSFIGYKLADDSL